MQAREKELSEVPTVITKDIVPTTTTFSDVYLGGVKLNINKLSGLADFEPSARRRPADIEIPTTSVNPTHSMTPKHTPAPVSDSLDIKCQKLLQKLFDHNLLITCGLYQEHVSAVLGKILQHYGVKMIEDYRRKRQLINEYPTCNVSPTGL